MLNYHGLVKQLDLPAGWKAPAELAYDDIRARAVSRADNDDDVQGINASIELQQRPLGGISDGLRSTQPTPLHGDPRQLGRPRSRHPQAGGRTSLSGGWLRIACHN